MKKYILFCFLFIFSISIAQEIETKLISKSELLVDKFVGADDLENIFYIKNNVLYRQSQEELLSYNNFNLGDITSVNIQNPFKIILFYKEFNTVIILDNKLSELTDPIDFTKETLFNNVQFVSLSSENDLWLLADDNKMHLYDYQNHFQKLETQPLGFYQKEFYTTIMKSTYKYVWVFSGNGVLQFNEYGSFLSFTVIHYQDFVQPYEKGYLYKNNKALFYKINKQIIPVQIDLKYPLKEIYINKTSIYTYDGQFIYQYNFL